MKKILQGAMLTLTVCAVVSFLKEVVAPARAQEWSKPESRPPINNQGQPPDVDDFVGYVRKSSATPQSVTGPAEFSFNGLVPARFGGDGSAAAIASIVARGSDAAIAYYIDKPTGVYAFGAGAPVGALGLAGSAATTMSAGVYGIGLNGALAGRFRGPVEVTNHPSSGALGSLTVSGPLTVNQGVTCEGGTACEANATAWMKISNLGAGAGLYAHATDRAGLSIALQGSVVKTGRAVDGYSQLNAGVSGNGSTGIWALASGSVNKVYIGASGYAGATGAGLLVRKGVYGQSRGGIGSANYSSAPATPAYDFGAGLRACVKNSTGAMVNARGIVGSGSTLAGEFAGDGSGGDAGDLFIAAVCTNNTLISCTTDADCGAGSCVGGLAIGEQYLTVGNLKGLLCKLSGVTDPANCP